MVFGRRKHQAAKNDSATPSALEEQDSGAGDLVDLTALPDPSDTVYEREKHGPFDIEEVSSVPAFLDLGALRVAPHDRLQLRLEIEESTQRVIAVTLDLDGSSLQLQAFAAPRNEGLWEEIRKQISQSVEAQGGSTEELQGTFGTEVLAKLPAQAMDGSAGYRVARFIGVDGPRWFLRGVLGGPAALDRDLAAELERLFRLTVVVRDQTPMPPRDLLPLQLPQDAVAGGEPGEAADENPGTGQESGFEPPRRGPEITQIG